MTLLVTLMPSKPAGAVVCTSPAIHDIQQAVHFSSLNGSCVTGVTGIVTAVGTNGFYMQEPVGDMDADSATSEGIFVFQSQVPTTVIGDSVSVAGTISEFRPGGAGINLTTTEIVTPTITVQSSGNQLPAPTVIGTGGRPQPAAVIEDDSAANIENGNTFDPATDGIDFYESLEAMLVTVNNPLVVGARNTFDETFVVADNGADATGLGVRKALKLSSTDFNPERVLLDDVYVATTTEAADVGDHLLGAGAAPSVQGIVDYAFGGYRVNLTASTTTTSSNVVRESATAAATDELAVATMNLRNLDPNDSRMATIAGRIVNNLKAPDLIALQEVEDNNGIVNDAEVSASITYTNLISAISTAGGPTYSYAEIAPVDDQDGGTPGANIRNAFLFRTDRGVAFVSRPGGISTSDTTVVGGPELSHSPGRINPTNTAFNNSRKPLAGEFTYGGKKLFVINVHFNSKGGDDPLYGTNQPPLRSSEVQRGQQAQIVADFVTSILTEDANAQVIVLGNFNDYEYSTALSTLEGAGLTNLTEGLPANERYNFIFEGNAQALDHILISDGLSEDLFSYDIVHTDAEFATRTLDHDPSVARFGGQFTLTVSKTGAGQGAISSQPAGIACGAACNADDSLFKDGTDVKLTANPSASSAFTGWSGGGCSGTGQCTVTLDQDRNVDAEFLLKKNIESVAKLTYSNQEKSFKVKVTTVDLPKCRANRKGALKRVRRGPDSKVKAFTTNAKGIAKVGLGIVDGKYYAVVNTRKFTEIGGAPVTCRPTRSKPPLALP